MPPPIDETRILQSALAVWREHGFRDATTRRVAEHAGIGEMTLFRRFGDKTSLFAKALELEAEHFRAVAVRPSDDVTRDLTEIVAGYAAMLERNGAILLDFLLEAPRNPDLSVIAPVPLKVMTAVAQVVRRHQEAGRLRAGDPTALVVTLLGPLVMAHALRRSQPTLPLRLDVEEIVCGFLTGWAPERR